MKQETKGEDHGKGFLIFMGVIAYFMLISFLPETIWGIMFIIPLAIWTIFAVLMAILRFVDGYKEHKKTFKSRLREKIINLIK